MLTRITSISFLTGILIATSASAGQALSPLLPLNLSWKPITASSILNEKLELFDDEPSKKKTIDEFKGALTRLNKTQSPAEQSKDVALIRQSALKLGPRARVVAELTAARITGGIGSSGQRQSNGTGAWRSHLMTACNIAAKLDEGLHEQTAQQALVLWRKIEAKDSSWASPPIDIKAQKQFKFFKAVIERQAIYDWAKGSTDAALRKYRSVAKSLTGSSDGGVLDLRIIELEHDLYNKTKQLRRWQRVLTEFTAKYQDSQALGSGQDAQVQRIMTRILQLHRQLVDSLAKEALTAKATETNINTALKAIDTYVASPISSEEKERVRALSGGINFHAKRHKAASSIFASLASESQGPKSINFWRKAIRSQTQLADWPPQPPWTDIPKGNAEARKTLAEMYQKVEVDSAAGWDSAAHVGLLFIATGQSDEAMTYWMKKLSKHPSGPNASRAAGWIVESKIKGKQWNELETIGRLLVKGRLIASSKSKTYRPAEVLGLSLIEGGLESLNTSDFKGAITKLQEFNKGWRQDARHDECQYNLALAYHGDHQYRQAVTTMEDFTKLHRRSKFRRDGLKKGGEWTLGLAWDDHVMYFLEAHTREFSSDPDSVNSLNTLADLYLGREIYDSAMRVMETLLGRKDLDGDGRADVARRLMETAARNASNDRALQMSRRIQASFKDNETISAVALSIRARIQAERGRLGELMSIDKAASALDQSQPVIAEAISEIKFLIGESMSRDQFKEEFFSLGARDPKAELEKHYGSYNKIDQIYKSACLSVRTGWCGPALHKTARLGEQFVKAFEQLSIAKTLEPQIIKDFYNRKKAILETVENQAMESDEKSIEQAKSGATNPDWTSAIMWQNGGDWSRERFTSENADHFIQWRTR